LLKPNPAACCPDSYYCTAADLTVCPRHHTGRPCCTGRGAHTLVNLTAWNRAHDILEGHLLFEVFRIARDAEHTVTPSRVLGGVLDVVLGVTTSSALGPVYAITPVPVK